MPSSVKSPTGKASGSLARKYPFLAAAIGTALFLGLAACSPDGPQDSRTAEEIAEDARTRLPEDLVLAEKYARSCMTCHGDPMNGAPLSGDVKAWAKRLEWRGKEGLLQSTLNGFGAMPPLGLCPDCSVEDFKKLIAFLANQPQPDAGS